MTVRDSARPIALITSAPALVEPFLRKRGLHRKMGIDIVLLVRIQPSMRLLHRLRTLRIVLRRQARINRTPTLVHAIHYFFYRWLSGWSRRVAGTASLTALEVAGRVVEVESANDLAAVEALQGSGAAMGIVVGADVLTRATLEALELPLYNVHMSDPAFVRGLPVAFWEIHEDRESLRLSLHELIVELDSGPIVAQRDSPIVWGPTLEETLRRTGREAADGIAELLGRGIPGLLDGTLEAHRVEPGPLRTTPTVRQTLRARRICRRRFAGDS